MDSGKRVPDIGQRTLKFGIEVIKIVRLVRREPISAIITNQLIRAGTSVGANIAEAQDASSREDFSYRMTVSLREAKETRYWLRVLTGAEIIGSEKLDQIFDELDQIIRILTTIIKRSKVKK